MFCVQPCNLSLRGYYWRSAFAASLRQRSRARGNAIWELVERWAQVIGHAGEITDPAYPGERLIACKNPILAEERARKREDLLKATEKELAQVAAATQCVLPAGTATVQGVATFQGRSDTGALVLLCKCDENPEDVTIMRSIPVPENG